MRLLLILSLLPAICFSQPLSEIKTKEQAEKFIKENFRYFDYPYDGFVIDTAETGFDNFKEGDFNHDGIQDLLVSGTAHVTVKKTSYNEDETVILLGDKRRPRKAKLPYHYFNGLGINIIPHFKVITIDHKSYVVIKYSHIKEDPPDETYYDTLFIKNDHVVPFTKIPSDKDVLSITFKTDHCFGTCPVFEMTIHKNLEVAYNGLEYVDKKGEHTLRIDSKDWDYLTTLFSHLKIETLKDAYQVPWTDDQTVFVTVTFEDGSRKIIEDYGGRGTLGLSIVRDYFFELRKF